MIPTPALDIPDGTLVDAQERVPKDWEDENGVLTRIPLRLRGPLESRIVRGWNYVNYYVNGITVIPESVTPVLEERTYTRDRIGRFAGTSGGGGGAEDGGGADVTAQVSGLASAGANEDGSDSMASPGAQTAVAESLLGSDGTPKGGRSLEEVEDLAWTADQMGTSWSQDSGSGPAVDLMYAASERTGIPVASWAESKADRQYMLGDEEFGKRQTAANALLDGNQKLLATEFPEGGTVTVYRGTKTHFDPSTTQVEANVLSSWTTNRDEAERFGIGYDSVLSTTVPISQIAGVSQYGLGNGTHSEVVLYGGTLNVSIVDLTS